MGSERHGRPTSTASSTDELFTQPDLSERLANAGVLPMFGFPTRVRNLYSGRVESRPDALTVSERPLGIAVSTFAPGAQVVRDGWVHTAAGFADYVPSKGGWRPVDPLSSRLHVARCVDCGCSWSQREGEAGDVVGSCPVCSGVVRRTTVYQPGGFRTDYAASDELSSEEGSGGASRPVLGWVQETPDSERVGGLDVWRQEQAQLLTINDNAGRLYQMVRRPDRTVVVAEEPEEKSFSGAIGELRVTDAVLMLPTKLALPAAW